MIGASSSSSLIATVAHGTGGGASRALVANRCQGERTRVATYLHDVHRGGNVRQRALRGRKLREVPFSLIHNLQSRRADFVRSLSPLEN
eukprot:scaffold91493_cov48-Phaeocystis_antarctica.AAC.1